MNILNKFGKKVLAAVENALLSSLFAVVVGAALRHRNAGIRKVNSMTVNYRSMSLN